MHPPIKVFWGVSAPFFKKGLTAPPSNEKSPTEGQSDSFRGGNQWILYFRRRLSAIMAMNSEFVGLPRLFCTVYPK